LTIQTSGRLQIQNHTIILAQPNLSIANILQTVNPLSSGRNNTNGTLETRAKENLNHPTYSFRCPHKKKDASPYHAVLKYRKNLKV
ncbi:MAG: hypothetical protein ACFNM8_09800, partial [Prevotella histicola]|uniref:hypothetical protein n=1 Tax=Prevotella histicola TaxID=470565 RepID=UPI00362115E4